MCLSSAIPGLVPGPVAPDAAQVCSEHLGWGRFPPYTGFASERTGFGQFPQPSWHLWEGLSSGFRFVASTIQSLHNFYKVAGNGDSLASSRSSHAPAIEAPSTLGIEQSTVLMP